MEDLLEVSCKFGLNSYSPHPGHLEPVIDFKLKLEQTNLVFLLLLLFQQNFIFFLLVLNIIFPCFDYEISVNHSVRFSI